jgi:predicted DNA-binding transcriptional regulator YafY
LTKADHHAAEAAMQELLSKHRSMVDDTDAVAAQCGVSAKTARRYIDTLRERHARGRHDRDE